MPLRATMPPAFGLCLLVFAAVPCRGTIVMVTPGTVTPQPNAHLIGGTVFPWTDRLGNVVMTVKGHFNITATQGETVNDVTVQINGLTATVTQTPGQPTDGTYSLAGSSLAVGAGASTFPVTVAFLWNGSELRGGPLTMNWYVYQVSNLPVWNPKLQSSTDDVVYTTSNLDWVANGKAQGVDELYTDTNALGHGTEQTRQIFSGFKVTGPAGVGDRPSMTVGIVQTIGEASVLGTIEFSQDQNPSVTGTMHALVAPGNPGLPWFDSSGANYPYVEPISSAPLSAATLVNNGGTLTWTFGSSAPGNQIGLEVDDTPGEYLTDNFAYTDGFTYSWGVLQPGLQERFLNGTSRVLSFEDVLVASTPDAPGVLVPVDKFNFWTCTFSGYLDDVLLVWHGGTVTQYGGSVVKPSPNGPANGMETSLFTVP